MEAKRPLSQRKSPDGRSPLSTGNTRFFSTFSSSHSSLGKIICCHLPLKSAQILICIDGGSLDLS